MSIKIITDRADNGNRFLCQECLHANIRSGENTQVDITCQAFTISYGTPGPVNFVITKCSRYSPKSAWDDERIQVMQKQAFYIDASVEGRGVVLVDYREAAARGITED